MNEGKAINQVAFPALIKQISIRSLISGDKEAQILLRFLPTDDLLDGLNRLHRADEEVMIAIVKNKIKQNGKKRKPES